jgi:hypothetical protein
MSYNMSYGESEYLLREGVAGASVIEAVDAFLGTRNLNAIFDTMSVAKETGCPSSSVQSALRAYEERGVITGTDYFECPDPTCRTRNPVERVIAARAQDDDDPCDGPCGGRDLAASTDLKKVRAYRVVSTPTP